MRGRLKTTTFAYQAHISEGLDAAHVLMYSQSSIELSTLAAIGRVVEVVEVAQRCVDSGETSTPRGTSNSQNTNHSCMHIRQETE